MELANYHTHCYLCDGEGEPEQYVEEAIKKGFIALGFSSHAPIPIPNDWTLRQSTLSTYKNRIEKLKRVYKNRIQIYFASLPVVPNSGLTVVGPLVC